MRLRHYPIPKEIASEIKFTRNFYMKDILIIGFCLLFAMWFDKYISIAFRPFFLIFMVITGIIAVIRPPSNPQKRMYEIIWLTILKEKTTYNSVRECSEEDES